MLIPSTADMIRPGKHPELRREPGDVYTSKHTSAAGRYCCHSYRQREIVTPSQSQNKRTVSSHPLMAGASHTDVVLRSGYHQPWALDFSCILSRNISVRNHFWKPTYPMGYCHQPHADVAAGVPLRAWVEEGTGHSRWLRRVRRSSSVSTAGSSFKLSDSADNSSVVLLEHCGGNSPSIRM